MNDPNGLIFHDGLYHLYYQHNPHANEFGNISWGHATSKDLFDWEHHEVALWSTEDFMIYSGCTLIDEDGCVCAIYTEHIGDTENYHERICIAKSNDGGFTFDRDNRQILIQREEPDFRDPKVFRYEPEDCWVMCVALPKKYAILFYKSDDLVHWQETGSFTSQYPGGQFWECPDLFPLQDETGAERWILTISGQNVDGKSWGMFYFIGQFDGHTFRTESQSQPFDVGSDFYAGITFEGLPDRVMIGWCGNWAYAGKLKEQGWSGMMSTPRRLSIKAGILRQEYFTSNQSINLQVTTAKQVLDKNGMKLSWSVTGLEVERSNSDRGFPEDYNRVSFDGPIQSLEVITDEGIIECAIDGGEKMFTARI